jgi:hypothetical protein
MDIFAFQIIEKPKKRLKLLNIYVPFFVIFLLKDTIVGLVTHISYIWDKKSPENFLDRVKTFWL